MLNNRKNTLIKKENLMVTKVSQKPEVDIELKNVTY